MQTNTHTLYAHTHTHTHTLLLAPLLSQQSFVEPLCHAAAGTREERNRAGDGVSRREREKRERESERERARGSSGLVNSAREDCACCVGLGHVSKSL